MAKPSATLLGPLLLSQALSPVITMLGLFLVGLEKPTRRLIASVLLIAGGVALASAGEVNMIYLGFTFQMLAEVRLYGQHEQGMVLWHSVGPHGSMADWAATLVGKER